MTLFSVFEVSATLVEAKVIVLLNSIAHRRIV